MQYGFQNKMISAFEIFSKVNGIEKHFVSRYVLCIYQKGAAEEQMLFMDDILHEKISKHLFPGDNLPLLLPNKTRKRAQKH